MEQDKQLKEILEKGAERASSNFTASVMANILAVAAKPFVYQPLVPHSVKRIFVVVFSSVIALIFLLCLLIAASHSTFIQSVKMPEISRETYQKIISGIIIFWVMFAINNLLMENNRKQMIGW